ncbi:endolytic transglycosylase MltG [Lottiidibacillus patelloidae]|nr:endolytic transglycosylase MltG [Lottiidibacillus patelloidae]
MVTPNPNSEQQVIIERNHEAKIVRRVVMIFLLIFTFTSVGVVYGAYSYIKGSLEPLNPESESTIAVSIPIGSSSTAIARILEENELIKDARIFKFYVKFKNESGFQAGEYALSQSMNLQEIIDILKTGKVIREVKFRLTIPEGLSIPKFAKDVASKTDYTEEEILEKLHDAEYLLSLIEKYEVLDDGILHPNIISPLEGYLHPLTYDFYVENPTIEDIIEKMLVKTDQIYAMYKPTLEEKGLSFHDVLTLASIIERESRLEDDRYKVSSVFHNRIKIGMALQSDVTIMYVDDSIGTIPTFEDTLIDSPYNTYKYPGIPVGPIANPSITAIDAAINPFDMEDLFFYARPNGEVLYSETYAEHLKVKETYEHEWHELDNEE